MVRRSGGRRGSGGRARVVRRVGFIALGLLVIAIVGGVVWANSPMRAEPGPLAQVRADAAIELRDTGGSVVLVPRDPDGTGLVFLAGARVDAPAYAWKLSALAEAGMTVVIVRPPLNFAILESRSLADLESAALGVDRWFVGGHSLGGVRACGYAESDEETVAGLILFGAYCSDDLSGSALPVLSLGGERDGLSTPADIAAARHLLPADAELVEIPGAAHAQFGDYGLQPGDGEASATDAAVRERITAEVRRFVAAH